MADSIANDNRVMAFIRTQEPKSIENIYYSIRLLMRFLEFEEEEKMEKETDAIVGLVEEYARPLL